MGIDPTSSPYREVGLSARAFPRKARHKQLRGFSTAGSVKLGHAWGTGDLPKPLHGTPLFKKNMCYQRMICTRCGGPRFAVEAQKCPGRPLDRKAKVR